MRLKIEYFEKIIFYISKFNFISILAISNFQILTDVFFLKEFIDHSKNIIPNLLFPIPIRKTKDKT